MLGDRITAFTVDDHGYGFARWNAGQWQPVTDKPMAYHQLPSGMTVELTAKPPVVLGADGSGQPLAATVEAGDQRWQVVYDGMTAFALPAGPKS